jgi:hypothetical protein
MTIILKTHCGSEIRVIEQVDKFDVDSSQSLTYSTHSGNTERINCSSYGIIEVVKADTYHQPKVTVMPQFEGSMTNTLPNS